MVARDRKDMVRQVVGARRVIGWILVGLPAGFLTYDLLWFVGHYVSGYFAEAGVSGTLLLLSLEALASTLPIGIGIVLLVRPGLPHRSVPTEHPLRRAGGWVLVLVPSAYTILRTGTEGLVLAALIVSGVLLLRASRPESHSASTGAATEDEPAHDEVPVAH